jgi:hypothetical protein
MGAGILFPVFVVIDDEIVAPIDRKPKTGRVLARVRNIERDARAACVGDSAGACGDRFRRTPEVVQSLNARYQQYAPDERPDALIRIRPTKLTWWTWT